MRKILRKFLLWILFEDNKADTNPAELDKLAKENK